MATVNVSIPSWFDYNPRPDARALEPKSCFNPILVRLQLYARQLRYSVVVSFQSHLGSITTVTSKRPPRVAQGFQSHLGSITTNCPARRVGHKTPGFNPILVRLQPPHAL